VVLDSDHSKKHVLKVLGAYCRFVRPDSSIITTDSITKDLFDFPREKPDCRVTILLRPQKNF
jgi:cephalosporin hydroxylase